MLKSFVFDTNVLLYDPQAILNFQENNIVIPITVIEEIDHFKKDLNEIGRNARYFSRFLDKLRHRGKLAQGVKLENGGNLRVVIGKGISPQLPRSNFPSTTTTKFSPSPWSCKSRTDNTR